MAQTPWGDVPIKEMTPAQRRWYDQDRQRRYNATAKGKANVAARRKRFIEAHPDREAAQNRRSAAAARERARAERVRFGGNPQHTRKRRTNYPHAEPKPPTPKGPASPKAPSPADRHAGLVAARAQYDEAIRVYRTAKANYERMRGQMTEARRVSAEAGMRGAYARAVAAKMRYEQAGR